MDMLRDAHAPEHHGALGTGEGAGDLAQGLGRDAAQGRHGLGRVVGEVGRQALEALGVGLDVLGVVEALGHDHVHDRVEHGHVAAGLELQHPGGVALHGLAARVHDHQPGALLGRLLEVGGGDRVVLGRVGADDHDQIGMERVGEGGGDGTGADALHQRRHRGGVAEAGAVVDIVGVEAGAD